MDIVTVADGQIIDEPGAYKMPMSWYHQQCCVGPSVSSTGIRQAENQSPWTFWSSFAGNPSAYPREENDAFDFGAAAHCLLLGDEVFEEGFAVSPFDDFRTKDARAWRDEIRETGKRVITAKDMQAISYMADNLRRVPLVQAGILDGIPEVSLIWQDEVTGLWVKSRPDVIQSNGQVLADLKTTTDASLIASQRAITKYAYDLQLGLAIEGIERIMGVTTTDAVIVFAEKTAPYHVRAMPIDPDTLIYARRRNRRGLDLIAEAIANPPLPTFADDETPYTLPDSLADRLERQIEEGTL